MAEPSTVNGTISRGSVGSTDSIIMDPLTLSEVALDRLPARLRVTGSTGAVGFETVEHSEEEPSFFEGFEVSLVEEGVESAADGADDGSDLGSEYPLPPLKWIHYSPPEEIIPLFPLESTVTGLETETTQTEAPRTVLDPFWGCL